jgi:predicted Zn-dependent peptidase
MNYTKIENSKLNETMYVGEHETGLGVFVIPKKGCVKKYATFATKFGSVNNCFVPLGEDGEYTIPDGVAHFLEHKLFEQSDGTNAFDRFALLGANANAFTSFNHTSYLFSCTDNFYESLEHLISYVSEPYFTDENVAKEQGIIGQEIRMYDDDGSWKVMFNLLKALYHENPVRIDIAGTVESIAKIDKDILYKCYNTYYNPSNMVICVVGDVNADKVFDIVEKTVKKDRPSGLVKSIFKEEPKSVCKNLIEDKASVSMPLFNIGFKDNYLKEGDELLKREIAVEIITKIMFGRCSSLYTGMYEEGLINESFCTDNSIEREFSCAVICGESEKPDKVKEGVLEELNKKHKDGFDKEEFEIIKKAFFGTYLRGFNNVETIGNMVTRYILAGINIFNFADVFDTVDVEYITEVFNEIFTEENMAMSIVYPV